MLYKLLLNWFKKENIRKIYVGKLKFKNYLNPFQQILLEILIKDKRISFEKNEGYVYYSEENVSILKYKGSEISDASLSREGVFPDIELPEFPKFIIDLAFYEKHTEKAKKRLKKQLLYSLLTIRQYLWDRHLVLTSINDKIKEELNKRFGPNKVIYYYKNALEFLKENKVEYAIVLDPYAKEELTEKEIKEAQAFLIGGIVDLGYEWKGATEELYKGVNAEFRKITFYGDIRGVPDRINKIISIILKVRYLDRKIEEAIIEEQTRRDILQRLSVELPKRWIRLHARNGKFLLITKEDLEELNNMFKRDISEYLKIFNVKVVENTDFLKECKVIEKYGRKIYIYNKELKV